MTAVFPSLPGLGWSVTKAPQFKTRIQKGITGRELRISDQLYPIWIFTLTFPVLRDKWDARASGFGSRGNYDELRTLVGFFLSQYGAQQSFLFDDPTDDSITAQSIGTGDGATTSFQLVRTMNGFAEPISAPNVVSAVYLNGVVDSPANYSVNAASGVVTFTSPPGGGVAITADFSYYFRVRFADDSNEFENFMLQLWQLKQVKLQSVLL